MGGNALLPESAQACISHTRIVGTEKYRLAPMSHVIVHTLAEACAAMRAAAEAGRPLTLYSPPGAAQSMGAGYFLAMIDIARRQTPAAHTLAVLDCGAAPGLALAALKAGAQAVQLDATPVVLDKIADIAAQLGATLLRNRPPDILDLRNHTDPLAAASAFLAR